MPRTNNRYAAPRSPRPSRRPDEAGRGPRAALVPARAARLAGLRYVAEEERGRGGCVSRDLRAPGLPRRKVVAAVVRLLESTLIRVGNEEYARQNRSFGLTTLRDRHASILGDRVEFRFRGKSGRTHVVHLSDRRLGRIVRRCQELPGQALFQYRDERGRPCTLGSSDVNAYLRDAMGAEFTAKDFRTWAGTVLAAGALAGCPPARGRRQGARHVVRAIADVASKLGNTAAVCRRCYVHPAVIDAYLGGSLPTLCGDALPGRSARLGADESRVLALLSSRPRTCG